MGIGYQLWISHLCECEGSQKQYIVSQRGGGPMCRQWSKSCCFSCRNLLFIFAFDTSIEIRLLLLSFCYGRNIISISFLDMVRFSFIIKNNTCSIYHGDIFYGDAHLSNGLYILNHGNPNAKSIYNTNTKGFKSNDLNITYLWHYCLSHINEKRISKLHQVGPLHSLDFESYEVCESCLLGKMTKSLTSHSERANDLLGIIHSDVCGPISSITR